ncbi:MAG: phosphomethylpyrimidine synthase ThiC [Candidatus Aenigmarchaeota archaeon]|nr:phosphomethylpyrimidine synthase ThiC [Candidatus Aenigmarchaeota archaeon]
MTQLQYALENKITKEMKIVAKKENIDVNLLREKIAKGLVVIPANINHQNLNPIGIGSDMKVKVNANIGTSSMKSDLRTELKKLKVAIDAGADTMMDLSTSSDVDKIRKKIIEKCNVPLGTVPLYQAAIEAGEIKKITKDLYLEVFEKQARDGIDFATVHAGVTRKSFPLIEKRVMKCVSRGGSFLLEWMSYHNKENFLYEYFDEIIEIAKKYDVTLSLGDGLRPGCLADATDKAQIQELKTLGKLSERVKKEGVQVMIEGPGHIPLNEIEKNVELEKKYCNNSPFYILGPLPTDIATGYDHIACAIGGALACWKGADFICYVTPKEHIGLPNVDEVREGVIVTKIAAHIADLARGNKEAVSRDYKMAKAREKINWDKMLKYAIDPEKFIKLRNQECLKNPELKKEKYCSMCGPFCVFKVYKNRKKK